MAASTPRYSVVFFLGGGTNAASFDTKSTQWKCKFNANEEPSRWTTVTAPLRPVGASAARW